mmetsp:Transcript_95613/g.274447  ORF Transcript_95613/g.274447 Transcript_95613/m.274447 type:complete len:251 (+) Transcript_95613:27-779(+)
MQHDRRHLTAATLTNLQVCHASCNCVQASPSSGNAGAGQPKRTPLALHHCSFSHARARRGLRNARHSQVVPARNRSSATCRVATGPARCGDFVVVPCEWALGRTTEKRRVPRATFRVHVHGRGLTGKRHLATQQRGEVQVGKVGVLLDLSGALGAEAPRRVSLHRGLNQLLRRGRHVAGHLQPCVPDVREEGLAVVVVERRQAREHVEEHHTEVVDVDRVVVIAPRQDLRREEGDRAAKRFRTFNADALL